MKYSFCLGNIVTFNNTVTLESLTLLKFKSNLIDSECAIMVIGVQQGTYVSFAYDKHSIPSGNNNSKRT